MPRRSDKGRTPPNWGVIAGALILGLGLHALRRPLSPEQRRKKQEAYWAERARKDAVLAEIYRERDERAARNRVLREEQKARYDLLSRVRNVLWNDAGFDRLWLNFAYDKVEPQVCNDQIIETERRVTMTYETFARLENLRTGEALRWRNRGGPESYTGMTLYRGEQATVETPFEHYRRHPGDEHTTITVSADWTTDDLISASRFLNCADVRGPAQLCFGPIVLIKPKERYRGARDLLDDDLITFARDRMPREKLD